MIVEGKRYNYNYATSWADVKQLVKYCKQTGFCCHDFETNGESPAEPTFYPTILSISFQPGSSTVVPLAHKDSPLKYKWRKIIKLIGRELIENPDIIKIAHNLKFEYKVWNALGIKMIGRLFDTMLQKYILDEERPHGLKPLVDRFIQKYAGYDLPGQPAKGAEREKVINFWSNVEIFTLSEYGALDTDNTFHLWVYFEDKIIKGGFSMIYRNLLLMAVRVLAAAEIEGMYTDREYLVDLVDIYKDRIDNLEKTVRNLPDILRYEKSRIEKAKKLMIFTVKNEIQELKDSGGSAAMISNREKKLSRYIAGEYTTKKERGMVEPINFGSPSQLIDLLFYGEDGFEWPVVHFTVDKKTKRQTTTPSTSEDVLLILKKKYDHPFLNNLLDLRALMKMNSTYVVGMLNKLHTDDRIHGSFLIHGTVTGRLSSIEPNLQNIPRSTTNNDIKPMFIAPDGMLILHLDYSQAELRVMAYLANEKTMLEWFRIGRDIHLSTACKKYGADYDEIKAILDDNTHPDYTLWTVRRKQAKTTNFGIAYEQGPKALAEKLNEQGIPTTEEEAAKILDDWFKDFPKIKKYINDQHRLVKQQGYVNTLFGRKRRLAAALDSPQKFKRAEALRQSVNSVVQGSASDFALFSSVLIYEAIQDGRLPNTMKQFGTVHDSLLYYIKPEDIHTVVPILADICRNPETKQWFNFEVTGVEMKVDFDIGTSWGDIQGYKPKVDYVKALKDFKEKGDWKAIINEQVNSN